MFAHSRSVIQSLWKDQVSALKCSVFCANPCMLSQVSWLLALLGELSLFAMTVLILVAPQTVDQLNRLF